MLSAVWTLDGRRAIAPLTLQLKQARLTERVSTLEDARNLLHAVVRVRANEALDLLVAADPDT